jgi:hypothetical protein
MKQWEGIGFERGFPMHQIVNRYLWVRYRLLRAEVGIVCLVRRGKGKGKGRGKGKGTLVWRSTSGQGTRPKCQTATARVPALVQL